MIEKSWWYRSGNSNGRVVVEKIAPWSVVIPTLLLLLVVVVDIPRRIDKSLASNIPLCSCPWAWMMTMTVLPGAMEYLAAMVPHGGVVMGATQTLLVVVSK